MSKLIFHLCVLVFGVFYGDCSKSRILGGYECSPETYPYIVAIASLRYKHFNLVCGGTLINSRMVLTAAHCFVKPNPNYYIFVNGSIETSKVRPIPVQSIYDHPSFKHYLDRNYYDIAIMKLAKEVDLNPEAFIKLPTQVFNGSLAVECSDALVMGYGFTGDVKVASGQLNCVDLKVLDDKSCQDIARQTLRYRMWKQICAIGHDKDSCYGDSGGPLICNDIQYGVVSFGFPCNMNSSFIRPGFYTRVDIFLEFIDMVLKNDQSLKATWGGCKSQYRFYVSCLIFLPLLIFSL